MPFDLNIAVKRAPMEQPGGLEGESHSAPCLVTLVEVTGALSPENSAGLTHRLDDVVAGATTSVIIRFVGDVLSWPDDRGAVENVAAWVKQRRRDGYSAYVDATEAGVRDAFMRVEEMKSMMLPAGADPTVPRRVVEPEQ